MNFKKLGWKQRKLLIKVNDEEKQQRFIFREKPESIAETLGIDYFNKDDHGLKNAIDEQLKKQGSQ